MPVRLAEQHHLVPIRLEGARAEVLVIAIAAPSGLGSLDAVGSVSRKTHLKAFLADDEAIEKALGVIYRGEQPSTPSLHEAAVDACEQEFYDTSPPAVTAPPAPPGIAGLNLRMVSARGFLHRRRGVAATDRHDLLHWLLPARRGSDLRPAKPDKPRWQGAGEKGGSHGVIFKSR